MKLPRGIRMRGGRFFVDVTKDGVRHTATVDTIAEANAKQAEFRLALARGEEPKPSAPPSKGWTIQQAIEKTLRTAAPGGWRGTKSERHLTLIAAKIEQRFGKGRPIHTVKRPDIDEWVEEMQDAGKANATINRRLAAFSKLRAVTARAGAWVGDMIELPERLKEGKGRVRYYTAEEERSVLDAFILWGLEESHDAVAVLIDTGLRPSELYRLTASDVANSAVTVWMSKGEVARTIPLTMRAKLILETRAAKGGTLFPGGYWSLRCDWERARTHLGKDEDPQWIVYSCRHTFCSRLAQRGVPLVHIKDLAGHRNLTTTLRYAHLSPTNLAAAISLLEPTS